MANEDKKIITIISNMIERKKYDSSLTVKNQENTKHGLLNFEIPKKKETKTD